MGMLKGGVKCNGCFGEWGRRDEGNVVCRCVWGGGGAQEPQGVWSRTIEGNSTD